MLFKGVSFYVGSTKHTIAPLKLEFTDAQIDDEIITFKTTPPTTEIAETNQSTSTDSVKPTSTACMASLDDDDDEVFFGAVSKVEKARAQVLQKRRRTMIMVVQVCTMMCMCGLLVLNPHHIDINSYRY